jgi:LAO/AO transport system kinase
VDDLASRVLAGDTRAAARLCRLVDDRGAGHRDLMRALHAARPAPATLVGVTGSPGAGKSTLVAGLVTAFRAAGGKVAVVAVDPTSPFSGGAILGDRIRMQRHFEDPGVFIRSLATRGAMGGLSRSARDVVRVLEAWGAGVVLLETVGVGQDEIDVTLVADSTVVVVAPGQGDDIQAIKAGILECADVFVVNKADRPGAESAVTDLENMLALGALSFAAQGATVTHATSRFQHATGAVGEGWTPPIVPTVATRAEGVPELVRLLGEHRAWLQTEPGRARRRARTEGLLRAWLRDEIAETVSGLLSGAISAATESVLAREVDPHTAVERLVADFRALSA